MPIVLRKDKRHPTAHPISSFVVYNHLTPRFRQFALSITTKSIPKNHVEAMQVPHWKAAMDEEMLALVSRGTWELVNRPLGASIVSCK